MIIIRMRSIKKYIYLALPLLCFGCTADNAEQQQQPLVTMDCDMFNASIVPFVEDGDNGCATRVNVAGDSFVAGDLIRVRIIAPYVSSNEYGESTWGGTYDNFRIWQWSANHAAWASVGSDRGFDFDNDFYPSGASSSITMPQATPFVFTATTWTEEIHYILSEYGKVGGTSVISFSNIFKADQRKEENYRASDVLWAQQYMETGTDRVCLSFEHKMAALKIDISEFARELTGSEEIILTLENMPDINQQEVTIGNYYAEKMKDKKAYGDYWRTKCEYAYNGKVLGIVVPNESVGHLEQIPFTSLTQDGVYTAYKQDANTFLLIIPPYTVPDGITPTLWLRQGEKRWSAPLTLPNSTVIPTQIDRTFESGKRYSVVMQMPATPDPTPNPDPTPQP